MMVSRQELFAGMGTACVVLLAIVAPPYPPMTVPRAALLSVGIAALYTCLWLLYGMRP